MTVPSRDMEGTINIATEETLVFPASDNLNILTVSAYDGGYLTHMVPKMFSYDPQL